MAISTILLIVLILLLIGALPSWNYSRSWGYAPSGVLGLVVVVLIVLLLMGRILRPLSYRAASGGLAPGAAPLLAGYGQHTTAQGTESSCRVSEINLRL